MKICVVTSYAAAAEPRAPRHAVAAKMAFPEADVIFVDAAPAYRPQQPDPPMLASSDIGRCTIRFPSRASDLTQLVGRKIGTYIDQVVFSVTGRIREGVFGDRVRGFTQLLQGFSADAYIAHNIETLLPAVRAARGRAAVVFDCMEYYSDMGDSQSRIAARVSRVLEQRLLPSCNLVIASSDSLADALAADYGIRRPLPSYNVPATVEALPRKQGGGLNLYWRNSVIGFGQRGLEDALLALAQTPQNVHLILQGRLPPDGARNILERARVLGIRDRLTILAPYPPQEAVSQAALFDIGLCLERKGPRNHELTVSSKMFDYHMAGLAVISSDLLSLRQVIDRSGGGLLYDPGNPVSLACAIRRLNESPNLLAELQHNARRFAIEKGNLRIELDRLSLALREALAPLANRLER